MLKEQPNKASYFKRGISCFKTKPSFARIADKTSFLLPVNRSFLLRKALPMNLSVANPAATLVRETPETEMAATARCSMPSAQAAEKLAKFLSSRAEIVLFIAAIVSVNKLNLALAPLRRRIFYMLAFLITDMEYGLDCVF